MTRTGTFLAAALMTCCAAHGQPPAAKVESPAERLKDLGEQYAAKFKAVLTVANAARTNEARQKVLDEEIPRLRVFGVRALDIAKSAPKDPAALEAIAWVFENGFELDPPWPRQPCRSSSTTMSGLKCQ